jgi:hypothetical protein
MTQSKHLSEARNLHTPGPWHWVEADSDIIRSVYEVNDEHDNTVADCGTNFANACLIAAAPDLLEALLYIREHFQDELKAATINADPTSAIWTGIDKMNAAIAKANGTP